MIKKIRKRSEYDNSGLVGRYLVGINSEQFESNRIAKLIKKRKLQKNTACL